MTPLDLTKQKPRGVREQLLGCCFLPRTIDKLRAELPGGNIGEYLNHDAGLSAYVVRRLGLDMNDFRSAVAQAPDEAAVVAWLSERIDPASVPAINAKLETFVVERMSEADLALLHERHPNSKNHPELSKIMDIIDADDREYVPR